MAKKTTVKDIAEKLGISAATISFVLNGQDKGISEDTRRKVIAAAVAMNYRKCSVRIGLHIISQTVCTSLDKKSALAFFACVNCF